MKKLLIILSIFMFLPQITNAGIKTKGAVFLGGMAVKYYSKEIVAGSIAIGTGLVVEHVRTKTDANNIVNNIVENINDVLQEDYSLKEQVQNELLNEAKTNTNKYNIALMTLDSKDWIDEKNRRKIKNDNKIYKEAFEYMITVTYDSIEKTTEEYADACGHPNSSDTLLGNRNYSKLDRVEPFMVSAFQQFDESAPTGDLIDHDHIPSKAAVKLYLKRKKGNIKFSEQELMAIENNAYAVAVPHNLHKKGRTWFFKNNNKLIETDSRNLRKAFFKDYAKHFLNLQFKENRIYKKDGLFGLTERKLKMKKARKRMIKGMKKHFKLNMGVCLFETI